MIIQHNIPAINSYRQLRGNNTSLSKSLEKLSSGYKVNRAGDDAAGLAISEKMRAQIRGLETAQKNANDGISVIQTAEGALTEVHAMLNRMVELSTQAANGIYGTEERNNIQAEIKSLNDEIDRIANFTNFNGTLLLTTKEGPGTEDNLDLAPLKGEGGGDTTPAAAIKSMGADFIEDDVLTLTGTDTEPFVVDSDLTITFFHGTGGGSAASGTLGVDIEDVTDADELVAEINKAIEADSTLGVKGKYEAKVETDGSIGIYAVEADPAPADSADDVTVVTGTVLATSFAAASDAKETLVGEWSVIFADSVGDIPSSPAAKTIYINVDHADFSGKTGEELQKAIGDAIKDKLDATPAFWEEFTTDMSITVAGDGSISFALTGDDTLEDGVVREMTLQVGDTARQTISVDIRDMGSESLGTDKVNVGSVANANSAIATIKGAISKVSNQRAAFGALQNRLEYTISNLGVTTENITAAESRIRDTDMAKEMMEYTKSNILVQSAQAMLAQANLIPQGVLQLLG